MAGAAGVRRDEERVRSAMDAAPRAGYLALAVMVIMVACLKLWWLAVVLACAGLVYSGKTFEDPEDW